MSGVRVLVGTRKGAFVLTSDAKRRSWAVSGPHFAGWEIYHLKGSPVDPNRIYASQSSGWFGQVIQRSNDGGQTWEPVDNKFAYDGETGTHQWYDGTPASVGVQARLAPRAVAHRSEHRLRRRRGCRHLHAPPTAAHRGANCPACATTARATLAARRRRDGACTPSSSTPPTPQRIFIAISAAGAFRTDDGGQDVEADQQGPRRRRSNCPTRRPRSATASTASRCTRRAPTCCSCRSTGT